MESTQSPELPEMLVLDIARERHQILCARLDRVYRQRVARARPIPTRRLPRMGHQVLSSHTIYKIIVDELEQHHHPSWETGDVPLEVILKHAVWNHGLRPAKSLSKGNRLLARNQLTLAFNMFMERVPYEDWDLDAMLDLARLQLEAATVQKEVPQKRPDPQPSKTHGVTPAHQEHRWHRLSDWFSLRGFGPRLWGPGYR